MRRESDATEPGRGGRRRGRADAEEVSQEETGWLDDLRGSDDNDDLGGRGFTDSGTGRWAKLSALNDDPAADKPARGGRPATADSPPARDEATGRRRGEPEATGRRAAHDAEPAEAGRRRGAPPAGDRADSDTGSRRRVSLDRPEGDTGRRRSGAEAPESRADDTAGRRRAGAEAPESRADDTAGRRRAGLGAPENRADSEPASRRRAGFDRADERPDVDTSARRRPGLDLPDQPTGGRRRAEAEDPAAGRRRVADDRRVAEELIGRRAAEDTSFGGRRGADEPTAGGRRAAEDVPFAGRRGADEPTAGGRRSAEELTAGGRRAAEEPTAGGRRGADEPTGGGRRAAEDVPFAGRRGADEPTAGGRRSTLDRLAGDRPVADGPDPDLGRRGAPGAEPGRRGTSDSGRRSAESGVPFNRRSGEEPQVGRWAAEEPVAGRRREPESPSRPGGPSLGAPPMVPRTGNAPSLDSTRPARPGAGAPPAGGPGLTGSAAGPAAGPAAPGRAPGLGAGAPAAGQGIPPKSQPGTGQPGMAAGVAMPSTAPPGSIPPPGGMPSAGGLSPAARGPVGSPPGTLGKVGPVSGAPMSATPMSPGGPQRPGSGPVPPPRGVGPGDAPHPGGRGTPGPEPVEGAAGGSAHRGLAAGVEAIRGARSEVRRQLREQQRVRMWTLIAVVVMVIGALPFYLVLRAATSDPVFKALDSLGVPDWAAVANTTQDNHNGSRWCLLDCRYRERTVESAKETNETFAEYETALGNSGWSRWEAPLCPPDNIDGSYSCWKRDEFVLDLYVRPSECAKNPLYQRPTAGTGESAAPQSPAVTPDASAAAPPTAACNPAVVSLKVFNAIADPHPAQDPNGVPEPGLEDGLTDDDVSGEMSPTAGPTETQSAG